MALNLRAIIFYTADPDSAHNAKPDGSDYGDVTYSMLDAQGAVTTDPALAVQTRIDVEPTTFDYELRGGWVDLPADIKGGTTDEWYLGCIGAPDLAQYGLAVPFVGEVNLEAVQATRVTVDAGRVTPIKYNGTDHRGKIRFIIKHPAGVSKRFQIVMETFR